MAGTGTGRTPAGSDRRAAPHARRPGRTLSRVAGITARGIGLGVGLGAVTLGYSLLEARWYVLRRIQVPVLAPGEEPIRLLHLSDLHLTDHTEARVAWVRSLAGTRPDVVVNTGDNLSFASGVEPLERALEPFLNLPGAFVMGDHDYFTTVFRPPTRYLRRDPRTADSPEKQAEIQELPWQEVHDIQARGGWVDLTNTRGSLTVRGRRIDLVGVDDPHAKRDVFPASGRGRHRAAAAPGAGGGAGAARTTTGAHRGPAVAVGLPAVQDARRQDLRLGLTHAPYTRVLDTMAADGVSLVLAGHTHGGQICLPGVGALVTNCDLDRRRASGLSTWPGDALRGVHGDRALLGPLSQPGLFLHVSAGLGTSPFSPVRLACRPEATLLTLVPAQEPGEGQEKTRTSQE